MPHTRFMLGKMHNPVRGFLHGSAAVAAIAGTIFLLLRAPTWPSRAAVVVFGLGLMALYTTSSLYHSIPWSEIWKKRMQRLDHSMIFVLIAATFTPFAVILFDGWLRVLCLVVCWGIALFGIGHIAFFPREQFNFSIALMITLGWLSLPLMIPIANEAGWITVGLLAAGGIVYTVGVVFLVTNKPQLWPRVFSYHELFHVFVVTASVLHFTAAYRYVVPLAA